MLTNGIDTLYYSHCLFYYLVQIDLLFRPVVPVVLRGQSSTYMEDCAVIDKQEAIEIGCRCVAVAQCVLMCSS